MAENLDQTTENQDQQDTQDTQDTQQNTQDWRDNLSDEYKNDPSLEKFKDVEGVVKSYKNLEKLVGRDKLPIPQEGAAKEDWDVVYNRLGRPESAGEYDIPEETLNKVPPEMRDEKELAEFSQKAHDAGLTKKQHNDLLDWYYDKTGDAIGRRREEINASKQRGETALRKEWGKAFDSKLQLGERVLTEFGTDELRQKIKSAGLNNDPEFIKFLSQTGAGLSEDTLSGKPAGALMTPDQAQREIASIQGNANHPYHNRQHPEHKFAVRKMEELYRFAYPE